MGGVGTHQGVVERAYHDHAAYEARLEQQVAALQATLSRPSSTGRIIRTGALTIDLLACTVRRSGSGTVIKPPPLEWALLSVLAEHLGEVVQSSLLAARFWPPGQAAETRPGRPYGRGRKAHHPLHMLVCRLRASLAPHGALIEIRPRLGYRLRDVAPEVG